MDAPTKSQDLDPLLGSSLLEPNEPVIIKEKIDPIAKLLDLLVRRSTYYWIACLAQLGHLVLGVIGVYVIFSLRTAVNTYDDDLLTFVSTTVWSALVQIFLARLLYFHYKGSGHLRSLAGYQHACMKFGGFMNAINCVLLAQPFVMGKRELVFEDEIRPIIVPLMIGFLFVASGSCFVAMRIIYTSAVNARGTNMVPYEIQVPAWRLATREESQLYRRGGRAVKLPL